jgi:hypothetical protein
VLKALDELARREVLADFVLGARASSSMVIPDGVMRSSHMTLDLRPTQYSLLTDVVKHSTSGSLRSSLSGGVLTLTLDPHGAPQRDRPRLRDALRAALGRRGVDRM